MDRKNAVYLRQALREMESLQTLVYSPKIRRELDRAALALDERRAELHSYEDGMVLVDEDIKAELEQATMVMVDGRNVSTSPFTTDLIDDFRHLVALDPDYAGLQNGEGLGKNTSFKVRRILAQFDQGRLNSDDLIDGSAAMASHFSQMNEYYASLTGMALEDVASIRETRLLAGELTSSDRIDEILDEGFAFSRCTYLYCDEFDLAVHVADADPRPLVAYRNSRMHEGLFANFYDFGQPKYDPDRKRTVNGEQISFASLLFPREPGVAVDLIDVVQTHYHDALVADDVIQLASCYVFNPDLEDEVEFTVEADPDDSNEFDL